MNRYDYSIPRVIILVIVAITLCLFCAKSIHAATISGTIYDMALETEDDVLVEIDTTPKQMLVSKNGEYTFNARIGNYTIKAYTQTSEAQETVIISDEGNYVMDIILLDKIITLDLYEDAYIRESDIAVSSSYPSNSQKGMGAIIVGIALIMLVAIASTILLILRTQKKRTGKEGNTQESIGNIRQQSGMPDIYEQKIIRLIKKEKRVTQKDIRKSVPLSEAKVSLIISDLEDKGKIRKIRKGRGNILIFVKD